MKGKKSIISIVTSIIVLQMIFAIPFAGTSVVYSASGTKLNILNERAALTVNFTSSDIGSNQRTNDFIQKLFDGYTSSDIEFVNTNQVYVQAQFQKSRNISTIRAYLGKYQTQAWSIEAANTQYDMDKKTGSYQQIMPESTTVSSEKWVEYQLPASSTKTIWKLNVRNASATNMVYLSEFEFYGNDTSIPSTPLNLNATPADSRTVSLNWSTSTDDVDVVGYKVFRNETEIGRTTVGYYTDTFLNPNTSYTYQVKAFDPSGKESSSSSQVSATTLGTMKYKSDYKALLLVYDPIIKKGTYNYEENGVTKTYTVSQDSKYSQLFTDKSNLNYIYKFAENLKRVSGGSVNYTVVTKNINEYIPYNAPKDPDIISENNIVQFGKTGYLNPNQRDPGALHHSGPNYDKILKDNSILPLVEIGGIDSVWIASSYDHFGFYETLMVGKDPFWINSPPHKVDCSKKFDILAYPGLECFGHMVESFIGKGTSKLPKKWTYKVWNTFDVNDPTRAQISTNLNDWGKFMLTDSVNYDVLTYANPCSSSGNGQVGNLHFPPNGYKNYSWCDHSDSFDSLDSSTIYGGSWNLENSKLSVDSFPNAKIVMREWNEEKNKYLVGNGSFEADVLVSNSTSLSDAGIIFRASNLSTGANALTSYYASINPYTDSVDLGLFNNDYILMQSAPMVINTDTVYKLKVVADGQSIKVYVNDMNTPKITFNDTSLINGAFGFAARNTHAHFDNFVVKPWAKTFADNWYNYPNISDTNPRVISNDEWNGDQDTFQMWVIDRIPRNPGIRTESTGKFINNWWAYLDLNHFDENPITCTIDPASFPVPPVNKLTVKYSYNTLTSFNWSTPQNSGITGYNIYRDGVKVKTITDVATTAFYEVGLTPNTYYTYSVKAFNAAGKESIENKVTIYVTQK